MPSGGTVELQLFSDLIFNIENQLNMLHSTVYAAEDVNKTIDDGS